MTLIALCRPYNSPLLGRTLARLRTPVLWTEAGAMPYADRLERLDLEAVARRWAARPPRLLTALEGCLAPLTARFPHWPALAGAALCKDKAAFRARTAPLFPHLETRTLTAPTLIPAAALAARPVVAKPVRGISSHGVQILRGRDGDARIAAGPDAPVLVEDLIEGVELAVDGYFASDGEAVVLGILQHDFADPDDVSDTLYWTSRAILRRHLDACRALLRRLNGVLGLRDFPFHLEVRADPRHGLVPIEMNPLRFAGYGTCEIGWWAFAVDPYEHFIAGTAPDWDALLAAGGDEAGFGVVCVERARVDLAVIGRSFVEILEVRPLADPQAGGGALVLVRDPDHARLVAHATAWRPRQAHA
ncbi:MAG: hypothetical protein RLZZ127_683 [Planctomycetota bacterium]|jgi:hypothetical protein